MRGHATAGRRLWEVARALVDAGAAVVVNDRVDVALATGARGVQLGRRSLALGDVRRLVGAAWVGYSAHAAHEVADAAARGADWVFLGPVWATASHPGAAPAGLGALRAAAGGGAVAGIGALPVVAIGGVTPGRVADALAAGAHGVAVLSGVWGAADPAAAAAAYAAALQAAFA